MERFEIQANAQTLGSEQQKLQSRPKIYDDIDDTDTIIDYFCVIGLDEDLVGSLISQYPNYGDHSIIEDLKQLQPILLNKFPPIDKKDFQLDESVVSELPNFAFPLGYKIEESQEQPQPIFLPMSFDGGLQKIFAQFLIVYEDIDSYRHCFETYKIYEAGQIYKEQQRVELERQTRSSTQIVISNEEKKDRESIFETVTHKDDKSSHLNSNQHYHSLSPKGQGSSEHMPEQMRDQQNFQRRDNTTFHIENNYFKQSEAGRPLTPVQTQSDSPLNRYNTTTGQSQNFQFKIHSTRSNKKIYLPKAICLLSRYPYYDYFTEIIDDICKGIRGNLVAPIESYLNNLILKCPNPPRGQVKVIYNKINNDKVVLTQPPINLLPYVNYSQFRILFRCIPNVDDLVSIFTSMLLERSDLVPITLSLQSLLYPFQWVQCIPVLIGGNVEDEDRSPLNMVTSPISYLIGIHESDFKQVAEILSYNDKEGPLAYKVLDNKVNKQILNQKIQFFSAWSTVLQNLEADRNHDKKFKQVQFPQLPNHLQTKLTAEVKAIIKSERVLSNDSIDKIRKSFFNVMLDLFAHYKEFIKVDSEGDVSFDIKRFISISNKKNKDFYKEFFKGGCPSQMFMNFITNSSMTSKEDLQSIIMHFDQSIINLENQIPLAPYRQDNKFLHDQNVSHAEMYYVQKVEPLELDNDELINSYYDSNDRKGPFIPLEISKTFDGKSTYRYTVFPLLQQNIYESEKLLQVQQPAQSSQVYFINHDKHKEQGHKTIYKSMFQKVKLSIPTVSKCEGTYVYLSWIYMWCGTLWMQDEREKYFRLKQILQVIAKLKAEYIQRPGLDLFFLLIETSVHYGTLKMTQQIYDSLKKYELTADARIQTRYCLHMKMGSKQAKKEEKKKKPPGPQNRAPINNPHQQKTTSTVFSAQGGQGVHIKEQDARLKSKEEQVLNPDSNIYKRVKYLQQFRKRTFKTSEDASILHDEVKLKLQEECGHCKGQLLPAQIRKSIESIMKQKNNKTAHRIKALCTYCGREIDTPKLKVMIGKKLKNNPGSYKQEEVVFLSGQDLYKNVEPLVTEKDDMKIDINQLRQTNKQTFWNLIYYFNDYCLPFEFILPYEDTKQFDIDYEKFKQNGERVKIHLAVERLDEIKEVDESEELRNSHRIPNFQKDIPNH